MGNKKCIRMINMSAPSPTPPPNFLEKWGPHIFPGGKLYVFKGVRHLVPKDWKNPEEMMKHLKYLELFEYKLALPEQRKELFMRQLEVLTRDLPLSWKIVACYAVSGAIIFVAVVSSVQSQFSKL